MRKFLMLMVGLFVLSVQLFAQNRTITGRVTDQAGNGVPNASVVVKGTNLGTTTTENGSFSLSVPASARTLVVSSVNFTTQEISIGSQTTINVQLQPGEDLSTVVVTVPYGTIKKTAFTGSETTISAKTLQKQQVTSVTRALEGQIPGLIATNGGGAPGTGAAVLIRGVGSINASSAPLYVLNGVPYDGSISAINTEDIESITVLKDAAASALYGSRAANGVIMITTKKGRKGRSVANAKVTQGFMSRGIPEYDRVGPKEYYELFWEAYRNSYVVASGQTPAQAGVSASNVLTSTSGLVYNAYNVPGNTLVDPVTGKLNPNAQLLWEDSWEDALFRTAQRTNATFNVSGASDKSDYYLSGGYLNEEGILKFSGYKRFNLRLNVNAAATDWLNTGLNVDGSTARRDDVPSGGTATTNPFYYTRQMGPIYPVWQRDASGGFIYDSTTGGNMLDWGTPAQMGTRPYAGRSNLLGSLELDERSSNIFNGNANTFAEIKFLKDFSLKGTFGLNYYGTGNTSYQNNQYGDAAPSSPGAGDGGRSTKSSFDQISYTANQILTWDKDFDLHNLRILAGHENYKVKSNSLSAAASGFLFPGFTDITNGSEPYGSPSSAEDHLRIESYLGQLNYDYNQKYLFSASYRTDGSSRFLEHSRWGQFYSAGVGWRISQEDFLSNVKWLNELKLKFSYGEQGNDDIGMYYAQRPYYYATGTGEYRKQSRKVNPDLSWETNAMTNFGVDFAAFDNRLQGTVEYFNKVSDNLLFDVPLAISLGSSVWRNIGTMKNYGIEVQLGYTAIRSRDFNWRVDVNFTSFKNKVTKIPEIQRRNGIPDGVHQIQEGYDRFAFYLREFAGVDASTGDALYYIDVLGPDGKPTGERTVTNDFVKADASRIYIGSSIPDWSGGLTNSFSYKNFELSFLATFAYGGLFYDGNYQSIMHRGSAGTALHVDALNRWQKPGDITNVPRLQNGISGQDGASTRWLMDASYLNLKNITLSYNLPSNLSNRLHVGGLGVFANVDNAFLLTAKKGMDPQRSFGGTADATYTPFRTVSFGINVNLQ